MAWTDHAHHDVPLESATAHETLLLALNIRDPREVEDFVTHLQRHATKVDAMLAGRGRLVVLGAQSARAWLFGPLGLVGVGGAIALGVAAIAARFGELSFSTFVLVAAATFVMLHLAVIRPDRRDWLALGTPLGAGVVAAWSILRRGAATSARYDAAFAAALIESPEYWHDLAVRALNELPVERREALVLQVFAARPDDLWHLLSHVPTAPIVRAALLRGPRSTVSADFHAFAGLLRQSPVEPVLEAIQTGAGNRDVLIRAIAASGNPAAADVLISALSERNERLRNVAREGLVALGPSLLPRVFRAFNAPDAAVQRNIAQVLRDLGPDPQIEQFAMQQLTEGDIDPTAAATLRRIVLTRRTVATRPSFDAEGVALLDELLAEIPAPPTETALTWVDDQPMSPAAAACLTNLVLTEGPTQRCAELASVRGMLSSATRDALIADANAHAEFPHYRMVLAEDTDLLRHNLTAAKTRSGAEDWVDVLERHASLAAVHALDDLWRTGLDGVVQTAAMAALMRMCGDYDGVETFADRALSDVLRDADHPLAELYEVFARGQFRRFERMMIHARRITFEQLTTTYQTRPAQQVLWGCYAPDGQLFCAFRVDEEYCFLDLRDERVEFPREHTFGVVHPAELGATACSAWAALFADYELIAPFEQLRRRASYVTVDEADEHLLRAFAERAPSGPLEALLIQRGWRPSPTDVERVYTLTKPLQRSNAAVTAVIELSPGFGEDLDEAQRVDFLAFWRGHHHVFSAVVKTIPLRTVDAVIFSEVVLELREILAVAASDEAQSVPAILTR